MEITVDLLEKMVREEQASITSLLKNETNSQEHNARMIAKAEGSIRTLHILIAIASKNEMSDQDRLEKLYIDHTFAVSVGDFNKVAELSKEIDILKVKMR